MTVFLHFPLPSSWCTPFFLQAPFSRRKLPIKIASFANFQKSRKMGVFVRQNSPLRNDFFWFGSFSIILSKIKFFTDQDMIQGIAQNYSKYDKSSQKLPKKGDFLQQISTKRSGLLHIFFESISLACLKRAIWTPKVLSETLFSWRYV